MSSQRYPEEFRIEAVKQILEHCHSVSDVSHRLGVSTNSLYKCVRQQQIPAAQRVQQVSRSEELQRLEAELKRVTVERGILKIAAAYFARQSDFIARHREVYSVLRMCRMLRLHPSGYYA